MSEFKVNTITNRDGSHGPQVCGITTFGSSGMQLPSGPTEFRGGRGRGVVGGGHPGPQNTLDFIEIATTGNASDFGDLTTATRNVACCASSTRGTWAGGQTPGNTSIIGYVTISSSGGANDFGDLTQATTDMNCGVLSDNIRGIMMMGSPSGIQGTLEFITIPTTGNSSEFGTVAPRRHAATMSSPVRSVFCSGKNDITSVYIKTIDFVITQTRGESTTFGETAIAVEQNVGAGNKTRGLIAGGFNPSFSPDTRVNQIQFITLATEGNATDFGDLSATRFGAASMSSSIRACFAGGSQPGAQNVIESVTIASAGNAIDFGDLTRYTTVPGGLSDVHGGLAQ
tara:strand:- start:28 stop:1050 length:1023 start_codon:yes stop_codon:yes gene_type:complete